MRAGGLEYGSVRIRMTAPDLCIARKIFDLVIQFECFTSA
jgi:hypothetical protein